MVSRDLGGWLGTVEVVADRLARNEASLVDGLVAEGARLIAIPLEPVRIPAATAGDHVGRERLP